MKMQSVDCILISLNPHKPLSTQSIKYSLNKKMLGMFRNERICKNILGKFGKTFWNVSQYFSSITNIFFLLQNHPFQAFLVSKNIYIYTRKKTNANSPGGGGVYVFLRAPLPKSTNPYSYNLPIRQKPARKVVH